MCAEGAEIFKYDRAKKHIFANVYFNSKFFMQFRNKSDEIF